MASWRPRRSSSESESESAPRAAWDRGRFPRLDGGAGREGLLEDGVEDVEPNLMAIRPLEGSDMALEEWVGV